MTFRVLADREATAWLETHARLDPLVIAYEVHRCCGGGKICEVKVRGLSAQDDRSRFASGLTEAGHDVLIDRRAAARLPTRFGVTVRGVGPLKHLDLQLDGEQWGDLLYT